MKSDFLPLQMELFTADTPPVRHSPFDDKRAASPPVAEPDFIPSSPKKHQVDFGSTKIEYELRRTKRRTIGFLVNESGLRVTAPKWVTLKSIEEALREKERWITNKLHYFLYHHEKRQTTPLPLHDGTVLPYLGRHLVLRLMSRNGSGKVIMNPVTDELFVTLRNTSAQTLADILRKWFQEKSREIFSRQLPVYAQQLGVRYRSFSLSSAKQRWGSCSVSGNIRLNWRLVHFSQKLIDYVIVHELAHLREMNHSKHFWDIVSTAYPDYKNARKQLNEQSMKMMFLP
jgi:predicted metal-dependent hydrolase